MVKYSLVGCDLDGTLFNDSLEVSCENKQAIEALTNREVNFVPITGRSLCEMPQVALIPHIRYIIYSNGAVIFDKKTGENTYLCMSNDASSYVLDTVMSRNSYVMVHQGGKVYTNTMNEDKLKEKNVCPVVCDLVKNYASREENFENLVYSMDNIEALVVFFKDDSDRKLCKSILEKDERLYVVDSWEYSIEIFSIKAGKDKALKLLCKNLGIEMEKVISIGDSGNDIAMTKATGLGLCASNGIPELKKAADKVICSNNENVVEYILREYF